MSEGRKRKMLEAVIEEEKRVLAKLDRDRENAAVVARRRYLKELIGLNSECHYDEDPDSCPLCGCIITVKHLPSPKQEEQLTDRATTDKQLALIRIVAKTLASHLIRYEPLRSQEILDALTVVDEEVKKEELDGNED